MKDQLGVRSEELGVGWETEEHDHSHTQAVGLQGSVAMAVRGWGRTPWVCGQVENGRYDWWWVIGVF